MAERAYPHPRSSYAHALALPSWISDTQQRLRFVQNVNTVRYLPTDRRPKLPQCRRRCQRRDAAIPPVDGDPAPALENFLAPVAKIRNHPAVW